MKTNKKIITNVFLLFFLVMPASTNYKLHDFGFGSGGIANSTSPDYAMRAITGQLNGDQSTSPNYKIGDGLIFTGQANVPVAPALTNPSSYYNKLKLVLDTSGNPTDTKYAIAISTDGFATTNYVQSDNTVGTVLGSEDYQTYAAWGGASGVTIIGLLSGTTYSVKVKAMQGKFTETGYGPVDTAATVNPTLSFSVASNSINFGSLVVNTVNSSPTDTISLDTNGESGASVYVTGSNIGLFSVVTGHKIDAMAGNLAVANEGFGAQGVSVTQTSGGPLNIATAYNQGSDVVGITDQTVRNIFDSAAPITGGSGSFLLKAKTSSVTPSAADYSETLTLIAAGRF